MKFLQKIKKIIKLLLPLRLKFLCFSYFYQYLKFDEIKTIFFFLKKKKVKNGLMIDVGSNIGTSAEFFLLNKWMVHCFEPDKDNFRIINKRFTKFSNIRSNNLAISDKSGSLKFYRSSISDGINSLIKFHESHNYEYKVNVIRLDTYLNKNNIKKIDFLKIDVEGNDFNVLKSIGLNSVSPTIIMMEYEDAKTKNIGIKINDILEYLISNNYNFLVSEWFPIQRYGHNHKWKKIHKINDFSSVDPDSWGNIIGVKDYKLCVELFDFINSKNKQS
jgi:FkbM family methyltransferase